jgi:hypothetical protein
MNGDSEANANGDEHELGEPIMELAELDQPPPLSFLESTRVRIERRRLSSQFTSLAWYGLAIVALEFVEMIASLVGWRGGDSRTSD